MPKRDQMGRGREQKNVGAEAAKNQGPLNSRAEAKEAMQVKRCALRALDDQINQWSRGRGVFPVKQNMVGQQLGPGDGRGLAGCMPRCRARAPSPLLLRCLQLAHQPAGAWRAQRGQAARGPALVQGQGGPCHRLAAQVAGRLAHRRRLGAGPRQAALALHGKGARDARSSGQAHQATGGAVLRHPVGESAGTGIWCAPRTGWRCVAERRREPLT